MRVIEGLYDGVTTSELDNLASEIAATMTLLTQTMHSWRLVSLYRTCTKTQRSPSLIQ